MAKVLIQFAHPMYEKSRVHKLLTKHVKHVSGVTFNDLYELYPDLDIDVEREQQLLLQHDIIIFQHPFYWYSCPAVIKQWLDLVLEHNWAYGSKGKALAGKKMGNAISCGGPATAYQQNGYNRFTIRQLLAPFDQTAHLCNMEYLPPFVVHGTFKMHEADLEMHAVQYEELLIALTQNRVQAHELERVNYLNDLNPIPKTFQI